MDIKATNPAQFAGAGLGFGPCLAAGQSETDSKISPLVNKLSPSGRHHVGIVFTCDRPETPSLDTWPLSKIGKPQRSTSDAQGA
jgi:hypothetical protein